MTKRIMLAFLIGMLFITNSYGFSFGEDKKIVKVFFSSSFKDENSNLQPFEDWYIGSKDRIFTLQSLYKDGWTLKDVVKINASAQEWQMTFFMEIPELKYNSLKEKYEKKDLKKNENVNPKEGL